MPGARRKGPRNSRPPRPRSLARPRLRLGLPPTVAVRAPAQVHETGQKSAVARPATPEVAAAPDTAAPGLPAAAASSSLLLRGEYWEVRHAGHTAMVEDCRGLRYIALLVQHAAVDPRPIHARELVALATGRTGAPIELDSRDDVLDDEARKQLFARLEDLTAERDRECAAGRLDRAARLDDEYERIAVELKRASTARKGGAQFSDAGEKARKAVSKAISEAVARIAAHKEVAALADHFNTAIRKGLWLSYAAADGWHIDATPAPPRK